MKHIWRPGDIARITRNLLCAGVPELAKYAGEEVTLMHFSGIVPGHDALDWWTVKHGDGRQFYVREVALRKRNDPDSFERGSWSEIQKLTGWHPVKDISNA